jgi:hypothetical protein
MSVTQCVCAVPGTGINNVAFGIGAMASANTGDYNTAFGINALGANSTANNNAAFGYSALCLTTGLGNSAFGSSALSCNSSGTYNTAFGAWALFVASTGVGNTAIGASTLCTTTTGCCNVAVGFSAMASNTTGHCNVAVGTYALYYSQTGCFNTAVGHDALYCSTATGAYNTAVGFSAMCASTGVGNTIIGASAGVGITTGQYNVAIGYGSLNSLTTCSGSVGLGAEAGAGSNQSKELYLGAPSSCSVTKIGAIYSCQATISTYSDINFKYDVKDITEGLELIRNLVPITYYSDEKKNRTDACYPSLGFAAQCIDKVFNECVISLSLKELKKNIVTKMETTSLNVPQWAVSIGNLVPFIVNSIKELDTRLTEIEKRL